MSCDNQWAALSQRHESSQCMYGVCVCVVLVCEYPRTMCSPCMCQCDSQATRKTVTAVSHRTTQRLHSIGCKIGGGSSNPLTGVAFLLDFLFLSNDASVLLYDPFRTTLFESSVADFTVSDFFNSVFCFFGRFLCQSKRSINTAHIYQWINNFLLLFLFRFLQHFLTP